MDFSWLPRPSTQRCSQELNVLAPSTHKQAVISQLRGLGLAIEDQGQPADYLGVNIKHLKGGDHHS